MQFVEEFIDQQLNKNVSSTVLQQLQNCHSAVQDLLLNLQSLRTTPRIPFLDSKIQRYSAFLNTRQELLAILQNQQSRSIAEWLLSQQIQSPLLVEIIRREQDFLQEMIQTAIKRVFLSEQKMEQYVEDNENVNNYLALLQTVKEDIEANRTPGRDKLKGIDNMEANMDGKIKRFQGKIALFNKQITNIIEQLYQYQITLSQHFRQFFSKLIPKNTSPIKMIPVKDFYEPQQQNYLRQSAKKRIEFDSSKTAIDFGTRNRSEAKLFRPQLTEGWSYTLQGSKIDPSQLSLNSRIQIANMRPDSKGQSKWRNQRSLINYPKPSLPLR